jgi:hypothetical protein
MANYNINNGGLYNRLGDFGPDSVDSQPIKGGTVGGNWAWDAQRLKYASNPVVRLTNGFDDQQRRYLVGANIYNKNTGLVLWGQDPVGAYRSKSTMKFTYGNKVWYLPELYYGSKVGGIYNGLSGDYRQWRSSYVVIPADGTYLVSCYTAGSATYNYNSVVYLSIGSVIMFYSYNGYQNTSWGYARVYAYQPADREVMNVTNESIPFDAGQTTHGFSYQESGIYFMYPDDRTSQFPANSTVNFKKGGIVDSITITNSFTSAALDKTTWKDKRTDNFTVLGVDDFANFEII